MMTTVDSDVFFKEMKRNYRRWAVFLVVLQAKQYYGEAFQGFCGGSATSGNLHAPGRLEAQLQRLNKGCSFQTATIAHALGAMLLYENTPHSSHDRLRSSTPTTAGFFCARRVRDCDDKMSESSKACKVGLFVSSLTLHRLREQPVSLRIETGLHDSMFSS